MARKYDSGADSAVTAAIDSLDRLTSFSIESTVKYTASASRAFNELKKDIESLVEDKASVVGGAYDLEKLRKGHALYMAERAAQALEERAFEETRLGELDELENASWTRRVQYAETAAAAVSNTLQNLYIASGSRNKAMFEAMKSFAVAETIIQTYRAAQGAYASLAAIPLVGPALGAAAAAAALAAGLARVEQIRSTSPGGATGSIDAGGSANPEYSGGSPSAYPAPTRIEDASPSQFITVQIYNPLSEQNWQKIVEDNIVPALKDASDRNVDVKITNMA